MICNVTAVQALILVMVVATEPWPAPKERTNFKRWWNCYKLHKYQKISICNLV